MSLRASRVQLATLSRELLNQWERTKEQWSDEKSQEFEATYLSALETHVNAAVHAMEELDELVTRVRSDCE